MRHHRGSNHKSHPFYDKLLPHGVSGGGFSVAAADMAVDGFGFTASSPSTPHSGHKFYVLRNLTVLAEYKSPAAEAPLSLLVLNDLTARQGSSRSVSSGVLPQSTPSKAMKLLGRSSAALTAPATEETDSMLMIEDPVEPFGPPLALHTTSASEAAGLAKHVKQLQTSGKRRRDSVVRRLVEDHDNELDEIQADLEEAVVSLKAATHAKTVLKRALADERNDTWDAVEALRSVFRLLGQDPPPRVSTPARQTDGGEDHSTTGTDDASTPSPAPVPPPPPSPRPPASSVGSRASVDPPSRRTKPSSELHSVVSALQSLCDSGQVCPTSTLENAVKTARAEERRRILETPQHERDLADFTRFLAVHEPHKAAAAASILEPFQKDNRTHVLFRLYEDKYKRPVSGSSLLPSGSASSSSNHHHHHHYHASTSSARSLSSRPLPYPLLSRSRSDDRFESVDSTGAGGIPSSHSAHGYGSRSKVDLYGVMMPLGLVGPSSPTKKNTSQAAAFPSPPRWVDDDAVEACQLCSRSFKLLHRRHHCRACGRVVCARCAPSNARKRIPELGYFDPVRHCKDCFLLNQ